MKKCIVLDLDNTIWGGVIGEDGIGGIQVGSTPPGNSYLAFQQALLNLYNRGIILAINSKNNYEDAIAVFKNQPDMILKEHHFASMRINWDDKAANLREIAKELNINLDSLVFLDDDPVNRKLVRSLVPEVETPDLPQDPSHYVKFLNSLPYFSDNSTVTDEDKMRGNFYVTERLRKEHEKRYSSKEDFLRSLGIEVRCYNDNASCLARLAQLTEKTNQFNSNKRPLIEDEIKAYIENPAYAVFYAQASDIFGDHGVIAFALAKKAANEWSIESLLVSCRVLGKGIEEAFLEMIRAAAKKEGAKRLRIVFVETEKNTPAKKFIDQYFDGYTLSTSKGNMNPDWVKLYFYEQA